MMHLSSGNAGRGARRRFQYGQLFPTASHWAEFRYAHDVAIDATMTLLDTATSQRYQILGAIDQDEEHIITIVALIKWQAKGSQ